MKDISESQYWIMFWGMVFGLVALVTILVFISGVSEDMTARAKIDTMIKNGYHMESTQVCAKQLTREVWVKNETEVRK